MRADLQRRAEEDEGRGDLRQLRRGAGPAGRRPRRDRAAPPRGLPPGHRAPPDLLLEAWAPARGRRGRRGRGDHPSGHRRAPGPPDMIILKSPHEIEKMARAGRIVASTRHRVLEALRPGITTAE